MTKQIKATPHTKATKIIAKIKGPYNYQETKGKLDEIAMKSLHEGLHLSPGRKRSRAAN